MGTGSASAQVPLWMCAGCGESEAGFSSARTIRVVAPSAVSVAVLRLARVVLGVELDRDRLAVGAVGGTVAGGVRRLGASARGREERGGGQCENRQGAEPGESVAEPGAERIYERAVRREAL